MCLFCWYLLRRQEASNSRGKYPAFWCAHRLRNPMRSLCQNPFRNARLNPLPNPLRHPVQTGFYEFSSWQTFANGGAAPPQPVAKLNSKQCLTTPRKTWQEATCSHLRPLCKRGGYTLPIQHNVRHIILRRQIAVCSRLQPYLRVDLNPCLNL